MLPEANTIAPPAVVYVVLSAELIKALWSSTIASAITETPAGSSPLT